MSDQPQIYGIPVTPEQAAQFRERFVVAGRKGGQVKSERKTMAARLNAKRPRLKREAAA